MKLCIRLRKYKTEKHKFFIEKQNRSNAGNFSCVPFEDRVIFAPHCLRNTTGCKAQEKEGFYICAECGACKINQISRLAKKLKYQDLFVVKGGRIIEKIIKEKKPKAIVGIACFFEGGQAFKMLKKVDDLAIQFVPLTKDGCYSTDTNIADVEKVLKQKE
jgi:hypothetical protein